MIWPVEEAHLRASRENLDLAKNQPKDKDDRNNVLKEKTKKMCVDIRKIKMDKPQN